MTGLSPIANVESCETGETYGSESDEAAAVVL
jgi:hypothetical protein